MMDDRKNEGEAVLTSHAGSAVKSTPDLGSNSAIGKRLKAFYDDVASEPVPDRFLTLLDALDKVEHDRSSGSERE